MPADRRHIAILGGSFDPIHIGHTILAQYLVEFIDGIDEVWLMLAARNPLKGESGANDSHRLEMLRLACDDIDGVEPCDIELSLPSPSYTAATLRHLRQRFPECEFSLLIGSDNWLIFDRWRDSDEIMSNHAINVYPRPNYPVDANDLAAKGVRLLAEAPMIDISSTFIRRALADRRNVNQFLPRGVFNYILKHKLYSDNGIHI